MRLVTTRNISRFIYFCRLLGLALALGCGAEGAAPPVLPGQPTLSVSAASVTEGDAGVAGTMLFTVSLSPPAAVPVRVDFETRDGSAVAGIDYVAAANTLTIPAGDTQASVAVGVSGDAEIEGDESLELALLNPMDAALGVSVATGTILDDDFPILSVVGAEVIEGSGGGTTDLEYIVTLNTQAIGDVTVDYATSDLTALAGGDYTVSTGSLRFLQGELQKTIVVSVVADDRIELDEELNLSLNNVSSNARLGTSQALGRIRNDDLPRISISQESALEGNVGSRTLDFVVSLEAATNAVSFDYTTIAESAADPSDFTGSGGAQALTIPAGDTEVAISIPIHGDVAPEPDETFRVELSNLMGDVVPGTLVGIGTIRDDDSAPASPLVHVVPFSVVEGDAGSTVVMTFDVNVDPPAAGTVRIDYETMDAGSAVSPDDYTPAAGRVSVPAGGSASFSVTVVGDDQEEELESFLVALTLSSGSADLASPEVRGYIRDDDGNGTDPPRVSVSNAAVIEGDSGLTELFFDVALSEPVSVPVDVQYATSDDTALAGSDYTDTSGTLTIPATETLARIAVPVSGDVVIEADERLDLSLSNPSGGVAAGAMSAIGVIHTDDPLAQLRISDAHVAEGDAGTVELEFQVSIDQAAEDPVTVQFMTEDGTATLADVDYDANSGTASIPAGQTTATAVIVVNGDAIEEDDEIVRVRLTAPSGNASLLDDVADGTILNDDGDGGWQPVELVVEGRLEGLFPVITSSASGAIGPSGETHAVWTERAGFQTEAVSSRRSGGVWTTGEIIGTAGQGFLPTPFAFDGSGQALAVWVDQPPMYNTFDGSSWGTADMVADSPMALLVPGAEIQLARNDAGESFAIWTELNDPARNGDYLSIFAARFVPGVGWQEAGLVETDDGDARQAHVAIDGSGNAIAVWLQDLDGTGEVLRRAHYEVGTGWLPPETVATPVFRLSNPEVAMNGSGLAAITWQDTLDVFVIRYDGTSWGSPFNVDSGIYTVSEPDVDIDGAGNVFVIWQESPFAGTSWTDLWANQYDVSIAGWQGAELLELDDTGRTLPIIDHQVRADDAGNAIAVWSQGDIFVRNVRAARYSQGEWGSALLLTNYAEGLNSLLSLSLNRRSGDAIVTWIQPRSVPGSIFDVGDIWSIRYLTP